ncbi:MAG: ATP-binding protein, partial [bacterium]|nr:ATP-binding protein [bacterium]
MLIQFVVENFLSFKEETAFNLIATSDKRHPAHINRNDKRVPNVEILKTAALYGANASGKSNLINTIEFARDFIIFGTRGDETISVMPFRLDSDYINKPSKFQFIFYHNNKVYDFGFVVDKFKVHEEWLFVKSNRNYKRMYERITTKSGKNKYEFGPSLVKKTSKNKYLRYSYEMEGTRANQLFLTEAFNRNIHEIEPVMHWFKYTLVILSPNSGYSALELRA